MGIAALVCLLLTIASFFIQFSFSFWIIVALEAAVIILSILAIIYKKQMVLGIICLVIAVIGIIFEVCMYSLFIEIIKAIASGGETSEEILLAI